MYTVFRNTVIVSLFSEYKLIPVAILTLKSLSAEYCDHVER